MVVGARPPRPILIAGRPFRRHHAPAAATTVTPASTRPRCAQDRPTDAASAAAAPAASAAAAPSPAKNVSGRDSVPSGSVARTTEAGPEHQERHPGQHLRRGRHSRQEGAQSSGARRAASQAGIKQRVPR